MDIVTHAAMGVVIAAPLLDSHPAAAAGIALGSVLPDLDVLSRLFGKRAFLRWHQTYTHSLPLIAVATAVAWPVLRMLGILDPWAAPALGAGLTMHALLDVTNTYGITLWMPFSRARRSLEWVFFIDGVVLAATAVALALVVASLSRGASPTAVTVAYVVAMSAYWAAKALLRRRAAARAPESTISLVPSALVPWRFLGCSRDGDSIVTFSLDALTGRRTAETRLPILDDEYGALLDRQPEVATMRELTSAYHLVEAIDQDDGVRLVCRDLRTRNFGGRFGTLTLVVGPDARVLARHFDV